jgi:hypothetical protein
MAPLRKPAEYWGRVYKDRWDTARAANEEVQAKVWLEKTVDMYLRGFETDERSGAAIKPVCRSFLDAEEPAYRR